MEASTKDSPVVRAAATRLCYWRIGARLMIRLIRERDLTSRVLQNVSFSGGDRQVLIHIHRRWSIREARTSTRRWTVIRGLDLERWKRKQDQQNKWVARCKKCCLLSSSFVCWNCNSGYYVNCKGCFTAKRLSVFPLVADYLMMLAWIWGGIRYSYIRVGFITFSHVDDFHSGGMDFRRWIWIWTWTWLKIGLGTHNRV